MDLLPADDAGVRTVLAPDADAGVDQDGDEESSLPLREPELRHGANLFAASHCRSSSARRGSMPRPLLPVVRTPPSLAPTARYRVNPARTLAAAWAPR